MDLIHRRQTAGYVQKKKKTYRLQKRMKGHCSHKRILQKTPPLPLEDMKASEWETWSESALGKLLVKETAVGLEPRLA